MVKQVRDNCVAGSESCDLSQFLSCALQSHGHIVTVISLIQWLGVMTHMIEKEIKMTTSFNRQNDDRTGTNNTFQESNFAIDGSGAINHPRAVSKTTFNEGSSDMKIKSTAQKLSE